MAYLLDTCAVSDFVKGNENTVQRLRSKSPLQIKISAITEYEMYYGLKKNPQIKITVKKAVLGFLEDVEVIPFESAVSGYAADIRADLEKAGQPIGAYDVLIAATALYSDLILITSNEHEFSRIPNLKIENWRSPL